MSAFNESLDTTTTTTTTTTPGDGRGSDKEKMRAAFNLKAFGNANGNNGNGDDASTRSNERSSQMSDQVWKRTLHLLRNWYQDDSSNTTTNNNAVNQNAFRKQNKDGYRIVTQFQAVKINSPGDGDGNDTTEDGWQLQRKQPKTASGGTIVLPMSRIFDAIYDAHSEDHLKASPTHKQLQWKYSNVTHRQTVQFVSLCSVCININKEKQNCVVINNNNNQQQQPLRQAAAKQPPTVPSGGKFRDHFQIGFIDMRHRGEMKNIYGVPMSWIMTLKDHFSRFLVCTCLPSKESKYVAHELSNLFGLLGFPHLFRIENNGTNDAAATEIVNLLKEGSPTITTTTTAGQPKRGRGSGSMNRLVKRILNNLEAEDRLNGISAPNNWTSKMGRLSSVINAMEQRGKGSVSAYQTVFGMPYGGTEQCSHQHLRACNTIEQRLQLVSCPRFDPVAKELCVLTRDPAAPTVGES